MKTTTKTMKKAPRSSPESDEFLKIDAEGNEINDQASMNSSSDEHESSSKPVGARSTPLFLDVSSLSVKELQDLKNIADIDERRAKILDICHPTKDKDGKPLLGEAQIKSVVKMSFMEELSAVLLFAFGVPGAVVTYPALVLLIGLISKSAKLALICGGVFLVPLMIFPVKFREESLTSWLAIQILKYFSCKIIFEEQIRPNRPTILVAPPHGVFPFGKYFLSLALALQCFNNYNIKFCV